MTQGGLVRRADETKRKQLFYDRIAGSFDAVMNRYDLERRLAVVFERFLSAEEVRGRTLLDVGCGTGWFARQALAMGAQVIAFDIGTNLLKRVREKCAARLVAGDACALPFGTASLDLVVSSECIEHTLDPYKALR